MSEFTYNNPPLLLDGHTQRAADAEGVFEQAEALFQSNFDHDNMVTSNPDGGLRGESFRRNGLTQFFRRRSRSESWCVVAPRVAGNPGQSNQAGISNFGYPAQGPQGRMGAAMPGGALKFRLRAPAHVLVYYTAVISRANLRDDMRLNMSFRVTGWLEDGRDSPGNRAARMAETFIRVEDVGSYYYERPDVSRGVFLNWKADYTAGIIPYGGMWGQDGVRSASGVGETGTRLAEGWHELTHTIEICDDQSDYLPDYSQILTGESDYYPFSGGSSSSPAPSRPAERERSTNALIIGDTELVVFAKYDDQDRHVVEDQDPPPDINVTPIPDIIIEGNPDDWMNESAMDSRRFHPDLDDPD